MYSFINNTDDELGIKSACSKLLFHLYPPCFYLFISPQLYFRALRKAMYCIYLMTEESVGLSFGHDNHKVRLSGKLISMSGNFILLLLLLGSEY